MEGIHLRRRFALVSSFLGELGGEGLARDAMVGAQA
jgi:hypothetical protein